MLLAHELSRQLHEVMGWDGPLMDRQHAAWMAWFEMKRILESGQPYVPMDGYVPKAKQKEWMEKAGQAPYIMASRMADIRNQQRAEGVIR